MCGAKAQRQRSPPRCLSRSNPPEAALAEQGIDAALLVTPSEIFLTALSDLLNALPSIIVSPPHLDIPFSYVGSDNYGAMRAIVAHLAGLGRRRIRLIQPYGDLTGDYWERARGYKVLGSVTVWWGNFRGAGPLSLPPFPKL
jgi:DNA-binding LacI/PurR family transcriptional regulator